MKKILFVRMDHIGDLLCCTPCIRAVKKANPDAFIGMLCTKRNCVAVENNPYIDVCYVTDKTIFNVLKIVYAIRKEKYDEVIVLSSASRTSCFFTKLLGIKNRIALVEPHRKFKNLFTQVLPKAQRNSHIINSFLEPLEALGIYADSSKLDYFLSDEKKEWGKDKFPRNGNMLRFAVFIGNVKKPHTHWGVENYVKLCEWLLSKPDTEVYVWGGEEEKKYFHLFQKLKDFPRFHFVSDLTFAEGGAFLLQCDALIVGSTGPTHLANALGVPILSVISNYQYHVWRTLGEKDKCVYPKNPDNDKVSTVALEDVAAMVDEFIKENKKS